ncbi:hypothetical protein N7491_000680 [Penicillium cf. griseofulvum]|nr:hypothetical protein N7491_000680 [Penicillium cf. griseofulvum]
MEPSTGKKRAATPTQKVRSQKYNHRWTQSNRKQEESKKRILTNAQPKGSPAAALKEVRSQKYYRGWVSNKIQAPSKKSPAQAQPKGAAATPKQTPSRKISAKAQPKGSPAATLKEVRSQKYYRGWISNNIQTPSKETLEEALPVQHNRQGWIKTEGRETLLAGYLGCQNVEELRRFIISWPILSLWGIFDKDAKKMPKKSVFRLADEQWDKLSSVSTGVSEKFAVPEDSSPDFTKVQKQRRVAWVCIRLAHVTESKYAVWSDAENIKETKRSQDKFTKENPGFEFPSSEAQTLVPRVSITYHLELGETRLELLNRSWELFRYFSWLFHTANVWSRVESVDAMKKAAVVQDENLPPWMRAPKEVVKSALVPHKTHEHYHPIEITAHWHRSKRFPGREDLESALTQAEEKGLTIPPPPPY